jgi:hypothetical protein
MLEPSLLMIDRSRSTLKRSKSALRIREMSARAIPVRSWAARTRQIVAVQHLNDFGRAPELLQDGFT